MPSEITSTPAARASATFRACIAARYSGSPARRREKRTLSPLPSGVRTSDGSSSAA